MKFVQDKSSGYRIQAYDSKGITLLVPAALSRQNGAGDDTPDDTPGISRQQINTSLILTHERLIDDWAPACFTELQTDHLLPILALDPELVILGTGATHQFPATEVLQPFYRANIGFEVMDTAAACRTFNILVSEGRHVVAALLMMR